MKMTNKYRVDRNDSTETVPCGMNSLIYLGDSLSQATKAYMAANTGLDAWNKPNPSYGVTLSKWNDVKNDYSVIMKKGFNHA
jgi:hypothetical protein